MEFMTDLYSLRSTRIQVSMAALVLCLGAASAEAGGTDRGGGDPSNYRGGETVTNRAQLRDAVANSNDDTGIERDAREKLMRVPFHKMSMDKRLARVFREHAKGALINSVKPEEMPAPLFGEIRSEADLGAALGSSAAVVEHFDVLEIWVPRDARGRLGVLLLRKDFRDFLAQETIDPNYLNVDDLHSAALIRALCEVMGLETIAKDMPTGMAMGVLKHLADSKKAGGSAPGSTR
jgi:hypothetical protein